MRSRRRAAAALAVGALLAPGFAALPAAAERSGVPVRESYPVPPNGVFALRGHGWGHGHGMSQYGAYGAAKVRGLGYRDILAFYYPHTDLVGQPLTTTVRVLLHAAASNELSVRARSGAALTVRTNVDGVQPCTLVPAPADPSEPSTDPAAPVWWRAAYVDTADGPRLRLRSSTDGADWTKPELPDCDAAWTEPLDGDVTFDDEGVTRLARGTGTVPYRGRLRAVLLDDRLLTVNVALLDDYLMSVVPSEMPASWSSGALQAQAVAARSYASYGIAHPKTRYYDVYDDTRDQMYLGKSHEYDSTNAAVEATEDPTAGTADVLMDADSEPVFAQFSSSDGGWTVAGSRSYLPAQRDPYDGLVPSSVHTWRATVSAETVASAYPAVGEPTAIVVTERDGNGQWGGRVTAVTIRGTAGSVSTTGSAFRYAMGLRSEWFRIIEPPGPPTQLRAERVDGQLLASWSAPEPQTGTAQVQGYRVTVLPAGVSTTVDADTRSTAFDDIAPRDARTVSVAATSFAGPGTAATVTTKVHRLLGSTRVTTAVEVSRATFADGSARSVVLVEKHAGPESLAAAVLARATRGPVLLTASGSLPAATEAELGRALPTGATVHLLGSSDVIGAGVRAELRTLGYRVDRHGGATPAATARSVANAVDGSTNVRAAFEVAADDPVGWAAAVAAAGRHGVLLLTSGTSPTRETTRWLRRHPDVTKHYAVGAAAATADPAARPVVADGAAATSVLLAQRFADTPSTVETVRRARPPSGVVAAARAAVRDGVLLLTGGHRLADSAAAYLRSVRADVRRVDLVGDRLAYGVEASVQQALLG